ncbi:MAG: CARDB domain-containing protein [Bacteroidota bacterium]
MKKFTILLVAIFLSLHVNGQSAAGYTFASASGTYTAITGGTQIIGGNQDDVVSAVTPIGFNFSYCGIPYTNIKASSNGFIYLGGAQTNSLPTNDLSSTSNLLVIAPFWDNLATDATGEVTYQLSGSSPNRVLTVEFKNLLWNFNVANIACFQIKLFETSNIIQFIYGTIGTTPGASVAASIGITDQTGGSGHFQSVTPGITPTSSSSTAFNTVNAAHVPYLPSGTIYTLTPPVPLCSSLTIKSSGGDYSTFTAAINDIQARTVCPGGITILVDAGFTSTENCPAITACGGPVTFQKSGLGNNPKITSATGVGSSDAIITIKGARNITFDGIDLADNSANLTTTTQAEYGYYIISNSASEGAQNNTIRNCKITLNRTNVNTKGIYQYYVTTPSSPLGCNSYNTYDAVTVENSYCGMYFYGSSSVNTTGTTVRNCTIGASTTNDIGNGTSTVYALRFTNESGASAYGNEIRNATSTSSVPVYGIFFESCTGTATVYNNNIHDLGTTSTSTSAALYGMYLDIVNGNIYNNRISGFTHAISTASSTQVAFGIRLVASGQVAVSYNSIRMALGNAASNSAFYCGGGVVTTLNNVFANVSTAGSTSLRYCYYNSGGTIAVSNNNDLYIATGTNNYVGYYSSANRTALSDWQTITSKDGQSVNTDPVFAGATDLHASASAINGAGIPVSGITSDFEGDTRSSSIPDMGADEFTPTGTDISISAINRAICINGNTVKVTLSNCGSTTVTAATLVLSVNTIAQTPYSWTGSLAPNASTTVTLTYSGTFGSGSSNTLAVTCSSPTPGPDVYATNNTKTETAVVPGMTPNVYTVGTGGTYTSLTNAATALNTNGICGPVVLELLSTYPGTAETFPITFGAIAGASSTNTITIRPAASANPVISGSATAIIKLNGTDYLTIDGSNNGSGSRNLSITNNSTSSYTAAIWVASLGTAAGATNITIKNCNITCGSISTSAIAGVYSGGTSSLSAAGDDNDYLTLQNNLVTKSYYGYFLLGSSTGPHDNVTITDNTLGSLTAGSQIAMNGINLAYVNNSLVTQNDIIGNTTTTTSVDGVVIGTAVTNTTFSKNKVHDIYNTGGYRACGFYINTGTTANLTFSNNSIYKILGNGASSTTYGTYGFYLYTGNTYNFYYNSVYLSGDRDAYTTKANSISACFYAYAGSSLDVRNNIFMNTQTAATNGVKSYSINSNVANTAYTAIDNNDYWVSGNQGMLGYLTSDQSSLSSWQTATGKDSHSVNANPSFYATDNLHASAMEINAAALPITGITTDMEGDTRNISTPDIGADEFNTVNNDAGISAISRVLCPGSPTNVVVTIKNNGQTTLNSAKIDWYVNGTQQTPQFSWNGPSLSPGAYTSVTLTPAYTFTGSSTYSITAATSLPNGSTDGNTSNDSWTEILIRPQMSGDYTIGTGGSYTLLSAAIADLNTLGVCGPVRLKLLSGYTGSADTYPVIINEIPGASATNTITIMPDAGATVAIAVSASPSILKLNGADYIIIDGSNNGSTSRNLTLSNTLTSSSTAAIWLSSIGAGAGCTSVTIKNCNLKAGSITNSTYAIAVSGTSISSSGYDNDNLTIQNNAISKAYYGIYCYSSSSGVNDNLVIRGNTIGSATATDYVTYRGIYLTGAAAPVVSGNEIYNIIATAGSIIAGIDISDYVSNGSISKNSIHDIQYNASSSGAYGINIDPSSGTSGIQVDNNMITKITTANYSPASTSYNPFGIRITNGTAYKIYYNSVNLTGTQYNAGTAGTLSAALLISSSSVSGTDIRNNIFANGLTGAAGSKSYAVYFSGSLVFGTINNNDYYSSGTYAILGYYGADVTSLSAWKITSGQDVNSISANPSYFSVSNLHASAIELNAAATPITGITTDLDGDVRNISTPDIGADEFSPINNDAGIAAINRSLCPGGAVNVNVTLKNNGLVPLNSAKIDWYVNGTQQTPQFSWNGPSLSPGAYTNISLTPTYTFNGTNTYSITATSSLPNGVSDANTSNDSWTETLIKPQMTGDYTIGTGGSYTLLSSAIADLTTLGVCGPVRLKLLSGYTGGTDTYPVIINDIPGASATNTITILPDAAATISISVSSTTSLLKLNGADYIIIDGSNNGSTSRNLTLSNTSTSSSTSVIWLSSPAAGAGNTFVTIKNCILKAGLISSTTYAIAASGSSLSSNGYDNDNLTIQNNLISKAYYGIYCISASTGVNDNLVISGNTIGSATSTDYITYRGIYISGANAPTVSGNEIYNMITATTTTMAGIDIYDYVTNGIISKNKIHDLQNTYSSGTGAYGINIEPSSGGTTGIQIDNNMIWKINTTNYSVSSTTYNPFGIRITSGTGHKIYNNSINLSGAQLLPGTTASISAALLITATSASGSDIRNNIFANSITGISGSKSYAVYVQSAMTFSAINYNDYYVSGTYGVFGYFGADVTTLSAWRTATGQDAASKSLDPQFVSGTDLHITTGTNMNGAGTPVSGITTDIDGNTRNTVIPDAGADEYDISGIDIGISDINRSVCGGSSTVYVTLSNYGTTTVTAATLSLSVGGTPQLPTYAWTGSLAANSSITIPLTYNGTFNIGTAYNLIAACSNPTPGPDVNASNDSRSENTVYPRISPNTYTVGSGGNYATIKAAATDLNTNGICGPVVLQLLSGYTSGSEVFPITFSAISGASSTNTVTIKPAPGASLNVTGSNSTALFVFDNARNIIIDGSNSVGGTTKDLTFSNTYAGGSVILYQNSSSNNMTKNCAIKGSGSSMVLYNTSTSAPGCSYDTLRNCDVYNNTGASPTYGVYLYGTSTANMGNNIVIQNNNIFNFSTNGIYQYQYYNNTLITGNNIYQTSGQNIKDIVGVLIYYAQSKTTVTNNRIHDLRTTYTNAPSIRGIYYSASFYASNENLYLTNNFISLDASYTNHGVIIRGIENNAYSSTTLNIYHNSVYIGGNAVTGTAGSACFYLYGAFTTVLKNNILYNARSNGSGTGKNYAIYMASPASLTSDYNDLLSTGTGAAIGNNGTNDQVDTTAWKAIGKDAHSISVNPSFVNYLTCDLHANSSGIAAKGDVISAVTNDFDNQSRPLSPGKPCIGADEFSPSASDAGISVINRLYCIGSQPVSVTLANFGTSPLTSVKIDWSIGGSSQPQNSWSGNLAPGSYTNVVLTPTFSSFQFGVPVTITAYTSLPNYTTDGNPLNDSKTETAIYPGVSGTFTVGGSPSDFKTLSAADSTLRLYGICGPVVLQLKSVYPAPGKTETFPITFNGIQGISASNSVTIKPGPGTTPVISGSNATALFNFDNTKYVVFDGSNAIGGTSKDLTISNTHASGSVFQYLNSSSNTMIKNCLLKGNASVINFSTSGTAPGCSYDTISHCDICNSTSSSSTYGIYLLGSSGTAIGNNIIIQNNNIYNFSTSGIYQNQYYNNTLISDNNIYQTSGQNTKDITGITINYAQSNTVVTRNMIHDLKTIYSSSPSLRGIYYSASFYASNENLYITNNFISLDASATNNGTLIRGIENNAYSSTTVYIYHNSIYLGGTSVTGTANSACFYLYGAFTTVLKNNILFNARSNGSGTGKNYAIYAASPFSLTSDYNDLLVTGTDGTIGYNGSNDQADTSAWKATGKDAHSISANPAYSNIVTGDLHASSSSILAKGDIIASVMIDYDKQPRPASPGKPCIGADEFTPPQSDAGINAINRAYCAGAQDVTVTLANFGVVDLTSVKIDWSVNGTAQPQNSWTGTLTPGTYTTVTLTPSYSSFVPGTPYTIIATTSLPNNVMDVNPANDSKTENAIYPRISGTMTVGAPPSDYKTLYAADSTLKIYGICAPVVLQIKSVYPAPGKTETFPITFNGIPGISAVNTVTIKPAPLATPTITGSNATALFNFNNTEFVTFDGSNTIGGTTKDLTISNTNGSGSTIQYLNGSANTMIKNCVLKGNAYVVNFSTTVTAPGCNNDTISNCDICNNSGSSPTYGIYLYGSSTATMGNNIIIEKNNIFNFSTSGIYQNQYYNNTLITGNNIYQTTGQYIKDITGITVNYAQSNTLVTKNRIHDLRTTYTSTPSIRGIYYSASFYASSENLFITNNFISLDASYTNNGVLIRGIENNAYNSTTLYIYHNSVYIGGNAVTGTANSACFYLYGAFTSVLKNNILLNARSNGSGTGKNYAIYMASPASLTSDYNDLLVTGYGGVIGNNGTTDQIDTTAWKALGKDTHSTSVNPSYVNPLTCDLHANTSGVAAKGEIIPAVTNDFDNQARPSSPNKPCIGADEFTPANIDAGISAVNRLYCIGSQAVSVTLANFGSSPLTSVKIDWSIGGNTQPQNSWSGNLAPGSYTNVQLTPSYPSFQFGVPVTITAATSLPNNTTDGNTLNDSKTETAIYPGVSGTFTVGGSPSDFKTLYAADSTLKIYGICGPVVLQLKSVYPAPGKTETFPITFNGILGISAINTLTVKPATGATAVISGSNTTALFNFDNSKYVIFDGSNTVGGSSKDLTISNTNGSGSAIQFVNSSSNIMIKNCVLKGNAYVVNFSTTVTAPGCSYDTISSCDICNNSGSSPTYGIYLYGASTATMGNNILIQNNNIFNFSTSGIYQNQYYNNNLITGNNIYQTAGQYIRDITGITVNYAQSSTVVTKNRIHDLRTTYSSTPSIRGIYYSASSYASNENLYLTNNFISLDASYTNNGVLIRGIENNAYNSTTLYIYHNSVYIGGTAVTGTANSACFYLYGAFTSVLKNNILLNARSNGTGTGKNYAIYMASPASLTSDYNDLLVTGTGGFIGYNGSTDQIDTTAWKALGKDAHSISVNPTYTNTVTCDLHTCSAGVWNKGEIIPTVTVDIDNQPRPVSPARPCIGADEITASNAPSSISATVNPVCPGSPTTLSVSGGSLGTGATWQWYSGSCGGTSAGSGNSISVSPLTTTDYFVRAEGCAGNSVCASLTINTKIASVAPVSATATPSSICAGDSSLITFSGGSLGTGATWQWYSGSCGGTAEGSGLSIKVAPAGTTTYYTRAEGDCNNTLCVSAVVTPTVCGQSWTGAVSTVWNNAGNWSALQVPTGNTDVTIPNVTNKPVITNAAVCKGITINSGATVTINPGFSLTANGPTVLNGAQCLILKAGTTKAASFIDNGNISGSGTAKIERYITANDWHYISSPINNATAALFNGCYLKKWIESTYAWINITSPSTALAVTTGYALKATVNKTIAFIGKPNTGAYIIPVTRNTTQVASKRGWNLVGNPYPSTINWDAAGLVKNNVDNAIYVYNQQYATYATYVNGFGVNGGSKYISPEQGFYVMCSNPFTSGSLNIDNSVRVHKDTTFFKTGGPADYIRLKAHKGTYTDEIVVRYLNVATDTFDAIYDGLKMIGGGTQIWSTTYADTSINYSINAVSSIQLTPDIPVMFKPDATGTYSITASEFNSFDPSVSIILEDLKLNVTVNIRQDSVYQFTGAPSDDIHRFMLHFTNCVNAPATPVVIQAGSDLVSDALAGNQWYEQQTGAIPGATDQVLTPTFNGIYYVIVNSLGCFSAPSNQVSYTTTGINNLSNTVNFELTPNPNNGIFRISSDGFVNEEVNLEVFNILGEKVYSEKLSGLGVRNLNLTDLGNGVYYLKVISANNHTVIKFVVNR